MSGEISTAAFVALQTVASIHLPSGMRISGATGLLIDVEGEVKHHCALDKKYGWGMKWAAGRK